MIKSGDDMRDLIRVKKLKLLVCIAIVFLEMLLPWKPIYAAPPEDENPPYLISVNRARNCVTIYKGNEAGEFREAVLSMVCSTAAEVFYAERQKRLGRINRWRIFSVYYPD